MRWNYYNLRQLSLLQSAMDCYYKLRQLFYHKVRHGLLQITTGITKGDDYYKLRQYKRVMLHVQPVDSIGRLLQPSSNYCNCLHFRFHLMARLPVIQVDWTELRVSFFEQTPLDSRLCPQLESSRECWTCVAVATM